MEKIEIFESLKKACTDENGLLTIINLDNLNSFCDAYGVEMAERLHKECKRIINSAIEEDDIKACLGEDGFVLFCKDLKNKNELIDIYFYISEKMDEIVADMLSKEDMSGLISEDTPISVKLSMGAVMVPEFGTDYTDLFQKADQAISELRKQDEHDIVFYDEGADMKEGAVWVEKEEYESIHNYLRRYINTYNNPACEMTVNLSPVFEEMNVKEFRKIVYSSGKTISGLLRNSDIMMQEENSFKLLLAEMSRENIIKIVDRIRRGLKKAGLYDYEIITIDTIMLGTDGEYCKWDKVAV